MVKMKEQFVTYEIALALKELSFNEQCFAWNNQYKTILFNDYVNNSEKWLNTKDVALPLWQQVIDWFREKHNINICVKTSYYGDFNMTLYDMNEPRKCHRTFGEYDSYEEAREQAILKAIELVTQQR